ncbi:TRAM domain-containing protein [Halomicrococcus sp. NG-SE-24]|uniref:TRAM domain-containing protein n=1 Tax=Halomicrococcus sp. NG-SE-24 TaxID=3436928 RepID=UPI003D97235F
MESTDGVHGVFSVDITEQNGSYTVTIPKREITRGDVDDDAVYRVALIETSTTATDEPAAETAESQTDTDLNTPADEESGPPVDEGDRRVVEIEAIGEQGDGIARVEHGYVIIIPETEEGDQVTIEVTEVNQTVAFGSVVERDVN